MPWSTKLTKLILYLCLAVIANVASARDNAPQSGDLVRITVYGQPDLTTVTRIEPDGEIQFPFIGSVRVGGVSTQEAAANIAAGLQEKGIVRNPQVTLLVSEERRQQEALVTVIGEVARPGRYPLSDESAAIALGLVDALALAGGSTAEAGSNVTVFRRGSADEQRIEVDINAVMTGATLSESNVELQDGDVVIVPKADVFYIYGQVQRPGKYQLTPNLLVMQAISISGGVTERGSERDVSVTRNQGDGYDASNVKLDDTLQPGDVIYVKERFF